MTNSEAVRHVADLNDLRAKSGSGSSGSRESVPAWGRGIARRGLAERNFFRLPGTLVKRQTLTMIRDTVEQMRSSGFKENDSDVDKMSSGSRQTANGMCAGGAADDALGAAGKSGRRLLRDRPR